MADAAMLNVPPPLTAITMRDRHVALMKQYAHLCGEASPDLLVAITAFQHQVAALGPGLAGSDARAEAQSTINYWQTVRIDAGERPDTIVLADFDHDAARREAENRPPYKGLVPFQTRDAAFFSGRFQLVNALIAKVQSDRLLALTGVSGAGKSSIIRAGLIPALAGRAYDGVDDGDLTDSSTWDYPDPILPGDDPMAALEARFDITINAPADLVAGLDARNTAVLLCIDQFEEVFTLSLPGPRQALFLDALVAAANSEAHRHMVIITMRGEYDGFVLAHATLGPLFSAGRVQVAAMPPADLRKAIEEPAQRLGVGFEPGLVEELLTKVQGEPAGLPLVSFTLLKLWEGRDGGSMTWADYNDLAKVPATATEPARIGGPREILANSADAVFMSMLKQDQDITQGIFTRLAKIDKSMEATSKRTRRSALDILGARDNVDAVIARLVGAGLLRTSPAGPVTPATDIEVAHEALIRNWGRLVEWVREELERQTNRRAFTIRAEKWEKNEGDLLSGLALESALEYPDPSPVEAAYIAASERQYKRQQRKAWRVTAGFAFLSVMAFAMAAYIGWTLVEERAAQRRDALIAGADQAIDRGDTALALQMLASGFDDDEQISPAMRATYEAALLNAFAITELKPTDVKNAGSAMGISTDKDGNKLMTLWGDGKARIWQRQLDGRTWTQLPFVLAVSGKRLTAVALSPDGRTAITASEGVDIDSIFSLDAGSKSRPGPVASIDKWTLPATGAALAAPRQLTIAVAEQSKGQTEDPVLSVKYDPDGKRVILALRDGSIQINDTTSGESLLQENWNGDPTAATTTAGFSPKLNRIVVGDNKGQIALYDATSYEPIEGGTINMRQGAIRSARFTNTGARFAIGTGKGNIIVFQSSDGERLMSLPGHPAGVSSIAFSPDATTIASGSPDGTVRLWEHGISSGRLLRTLTIAPPGAKSRPVTGVAFTDDGDGLAVTTADGAVRLVDFNGKTLKPAPRFVATHADQPTELLAISGDRNVVVTVSVAKQSPGKAGRQPSHVDVWKVASGERLMSERFDGDVFGAELSFDGTDVALFREDLSDANGFLLDIRKTADGAKIAAPKLLIEAYGDSFDWPSEATMSGDGSSVLVTMESGKVLGWTRGTNGLQTLVPHREEVVHNSLDTSRLVMPMRTPAIFAYSRDGTAATIHDRSTGKIVVRIAADRTAGKIGDMRFTPDGTRLFIGRDNGGGAIYDATTGKRLVKLADRHDNGMTTSRFSADGRRLVTAAIDSTARVWDAATGELINVFVSPQGIPSVEISADGSRIITGSESRTAILWDVASGKMLTELPGPFKSGESLGWFENGSADNAVTLARNGALRFWDIKTVFDRNTLIDACKNERRPSAGNPDRPATAGGPVCQPKATTGNILDVISAKLAALW